ncbi:MAG: aspartate--tRNA ligase [Candidatus Saccharimonas sp.]
MKRILSNEVASRLGETVCVAGWAHTRRDHGGVIFIDLRDHKGLVQLVVNPETKDAFALAEGVRDEFVLKVEGIVRDRGPGLVNPHLESGSVEIAVGSMEILNRADALPIQPFAEENQAGEELRLKYRFLDMRRPKVQHMLQKRAQMYRRIHEYMDEREFIEVQTPILANSSPEGARDFLIPSRLQEGKFYALPQAPQQFKQLLMVGGVPRYYQLAACFRDEDPRADRLYGEFYQLDLEMSFVDNGEEVRQEVEPLIKQLATDFAKKTLLTDDIPRIPYTESMEKYGTDKPDLRFGMELTELTDIFHNTQFSVFRSVVEQGGVIKAICVKDGARLSRKQIDTFTTIAKSEGAGGLAYITYDAGEAKSPIVKFMSEQELSQTKERLGATDGDTIFFGADKRSTVNKVLGRLRNEFAQHFNLKDPTVVALAWIVDFPFYEWDDRQKKLDFGHNPFSMPKGGMAALDVEDKLSIVADQYDMVMNGYEICSGGVRNHNPEVLYKVFEVLGFTKEYVEEKFGAMLNAFKFGAPPHAGCAFGVDRILMELMNETNVREVVAFPKNGSGVDLMMNSPGHVDQGQLEELGLS